MATTPSVPFNEVVPVRALPADLVEDLQRVQKAAQRITSILDLDQLIDSVVNEVTQSFGCLETSIYLHDEKRSEMVLAGVRGCTLHDKGHRLKIGKEGMVGYVAATGQTRYAPDVREDHASYIASWIKVLKDDKRAIFTAASHAQRAADFLHGLQMSAAARSDAA